MTNMSSVVQWFSLIIQSFSLIGIIWGIVHVVGIVKADVEDWRRRLVVAESTLTEMIKEREIQSSNLAAVKVSIELLAQEIHRMRDRLDTFLDKGVRHG